MADSGQTILLTGATGQVGGAALRELGSLRVRVLARSTESAAALRAALPRPASPDGDAHGGAVPPATPDPASPDSGAHGGAVPPTLPRPASPDGGAVPPATPRPASPDRNAHGGAVPPPVSPATSSDAAAVAAAGGRPEVVVGSFDGADSLRRALDGVDVLFLTGRDNPDQVAQHLRVLELAASAGVSHVVKLSAIGARADSPVALMRWHAAIEDALRASAFAWTFLRPHLYMQNILRFAGEVAGAGRLAAPMGAAAFPFVDTRDLGAAVAAVLRDPAAHEGASYALTGPSAVTYAEIAAALSALVGAPVRYEPLDPHAFHAGLLDAGIPRWRADDLAAIGSAYTAADTAVTGDLAALLGRPATPLARFLNDHRETYLAGASRSHL